MNVLTSLVAMVLMCAGCGDARVPASAEPAAAVPPEALARVPAPSGSLALSGVVTYTGDAKGAAVFVSVRDPGGGPPLAAKKFLPGPFPLAFELTDADVISMGPPRPIPDKVMLKITLDSDGDAMSKAATDPKAIVETAATAADVAITLAAE